MKGNDVKLDDIIDAVRFGTKKAVSGAGEFAKTMAKKTNGLIDRAKLSYAIDETEEKIGELAKEIGMLIYDQSKNAGEMPEDIGERCRKMELLYDELAILKKKIAEGREEKICPECGTANNITAQFCQQCGSRFDKDEQAENEGDSVYEEAEEEDTITLKPRKKADE